MGREDRGDGRLGGLRARTRKALDQALAAVGRELGRAANDTLTGEFNHLERFADVEPGLERLRQAGHTMVVFSNGSPRMLEPLMA